MLNEIAVYEARIKELEKENRILKKRLERAISDQLLLESTNARKESLLRKAFQEIKESQQKFNSQALLLQNIWDNVDYGIYIFEVLDNGANFRLLKTNPAQLKLTHIPAELMIGKTLLEVFPSAIATSYKQKYAECAFTGKSLSFSEKWEFNGEECWLQVYISPIKDETGKVYQIIVTFTNITERKRTEAALAESEAKFRLLVEGANDIIFSYTLDGIFTYISPKITDILGYKASELVGESFISLTHPDDLPVCMAITEKIIKTGEKTSGTEFRVLHKNGVYRWLSVNTSPIVDVKGKVIGIQGIASDISDRKRQERSLRLMVEGTVSQIGEDFFRSCVQHLAQALEVKYAFISQTIDDRANKAKMLAFWTGEGFGSTYEYDLAGTPCGLAAAKKTACRYPDSLQALFPDDPDLVAWEVESYLGMPIFNSQGHFLGNIGVLDTQPMHNELETQEAILRVFAARAGAEIERKRAEQALRSDGDRQALLNKLTDQIRKSLDLDTVIETATKTTCELMQTDCAYFGWFHPNTNPPTWEFIKQSSLGKVPSFVGTYPSTAPAMTQRLLEQELVCIDDTENCDDLDYREALQYLGIKSQILVPIRTNLGRIGVFICTNIQQTHNWSQTEISLLKAVGDQIAIAIDQAELYAQSRTKSQELENTLKELQRTQTQMLQAEKMSSLGQLVAGIAHEINNPVSFIHGNLIYSKEYILDLLDLIELYQYEYPNPSQVIADKIEEIELDFLIDDLPKLLNSMQVGTNRIDEIVKSLRIFSRLDEAEVKAINIHSGIDSTLMILENRLKAKPHRDAIKIIKNYNNLPLLECYAGQLNQVFMNILTNAIDALEEKIDICRKGVSHEERDLSFTPQIAIRTSVLDSEWIEIAIADNGCGMSEDVKQRIFDPFFTTKPVGKGTGMGMSISYQIVTEKHRGKLECFSTPGKGTEFSIKIPIYQGVVET